ncbi:hypothetical protein BH683_017510 [Williamsia sp. 1138]|uniref:iron-containing redox enzyme family protein n=1 Tax=Williamsia sp. 1138 TaxID=1903117 RepID=UPI000A0F4890|nr:iron-containing redox enzyme family protein [Williamsia sp. 1138]OZG27675.1 hypothetical protein BH683_017510 [Williamsia sp. 1138]
MTSSLSPITRTLPAPCGPLSSAVTDALAGTPTTSWELPNVSQSAWDTQAYGKDLQLALYICYELHYRGFTDVDDEWEWNLDILRFRAQLEQVFLGALRADVEAGDDATAEIEALSIEPGESDGPSFHLRDEGTWEQMRETFVHRSIYHLKEADPHAFAIPRLTGQAKASFVAVEFDEFGGGKGENLHQQLFADLLTAAGLDAGYLAYIDHVPGESLALVNLMSMIGLHRSLRGATIGHFAATEITSSPGSRRLMEALERMGAPEACVRFYREHVEADAVHEQLMRHEVVGDLLAREPELESDVVFGIRAFGYLEDKLADLLMTAWREGRSSLLIPVD